MNTQIDKNGFLEEDLTNLTVVLTYLRQYNIISENEREEILREETKKEKNVKLLDLIQRKNLGNLHLGIQLNIEALNNGKIASNNATEATTSNDLRNIVDTKFYEFGKTVIEHIKTSLGLIEKEKHGKVATDILMYLGYLRPDNIRSKFLMKVMKLELKILKKAIDLLEKYSLVSITGTVQETPYDGGILNNLLGWDKMRVEMYLLKIHRLIQEVIRHNWRNSEKEILRKILGCNGFLDYKIIPFIKYANDELRNEFPKVKAQLLDQQLLKKFLKEKRLHESVQLAKFVDKEINSTTTKFNYAVCLSKDGQLKEAVNVLTLLIKKEERNDDYVTQVSKRYSNLDCYKFKEIVDLIAEVTQNQIAYFLFNLYFQLGKIGKNEDAVITLKDNVPGTLEVVSSHILHSLLEEKRFNESVLLSRSIDQEINTNTTKFNHAICLELNRQLEEGIKVLETLYKQDTEEEMSYGYNSVEMGLLNLETEVSKSLVGGHLLISHWKMDNKEGLQEILEERKSFLIIRSQGLMTTLIKILASNLLMQYNYTLTIDDKPMFKIAFGGDTKKLKLNNNSADVPIPLPNDLQELVVAEENGFGLRNSEDINLIDISDWLPKKLSRLEINYKFRKQILFSLESISSIENLTLSNCSLSLDYVIRISPRQLTLGNVSFVKNGQEISKINVNEFIDFQKLNRLELLFDIEKRNVSIDMSEESANIEYLKLEGVTVVSLKSANNNNGRVNIKEAEIEMCLLDLSVLPSSLEKLSLSFTKVFVSGGIELPNMKYLQLDDISHLLHFLSFQLTNLHLRNVYEINVDMLPLSIRILRMDRISSTTAFLSRNWKRSTKLVGGVFHLDKLILFGFPWKEVEKVLPHFQTKQLFLQDESYKPLDLIHVKQKQWGPKLTTIAIGPVDWGDDDFKNSSFSKHVDRKSEYYLFHEGKGNTIEKKKFDELTIS